MLDGLPEGRSARWRAGSFTGATRAADQARVVVLKDVLDESLAACLASAARVCARAARTIYRAAHRGFIGLSC